ncbi:Cysteine-rich with EGF-like domain protein 2-B [Acipenser ruthenus]|uniref:Cysteine-rich with EGF-like domain protein 2-B n=1 Tax=Acipenser ruthenus TaxID=7906 RepID=A0A444U5L9_ACIRT|nr:Cysteine-rich with EGF-like domain protein 2-B [Acipenser ruthenus]
MDSEENLSHNSEDTSSKHEDFTEDNGKPENTKGRSNIKEEPDNSEYENMLTGYTNTLCDVAVYAKSDVPHELASGQSSMDTQTAILPSPEGVFEKDIQTLTSPSDDDQDSVLQQNKKTMKRKAEMMTDETSEKVNKSINIKEETENCINDSTCVGGSERPCHDNGDCDGDGTRRGDGKCRCNKGYKGDFCLECDDGYFNKERNDTFSLCTECHESCQTCSGPTNKDCNECKSGWVQDDEKSCNDMDECANETSPCKENQYCHNKEGSYSCKDINECSLPDKSCLRENEDCVNTKGSFKCVCSQGFEDKDGACIQTEETGKSGLLGSGLMYFNNPRCNQPMKS